MLTAAVRDVHRASRGAYRIAVETACPALWENNPYLTPDALKDPAATRIDCGHPPLLDRQGNALAGPPRHYIESIHQLLESRLGHSVPLTRFAPDLHLSEAERCEPPLELLPGYWVIVAGGKRDLTTKWWPAAHWQAVIDRFAGAIRFVQAGAAGDEHPRLGGVTDAVGRTTLREFVRLIAHAEGVVCGVTCAMHLAAAFDKPCVVVAGGREPVAWEQYPTHQFLHTIGQLPCCRTGGCWKARVVPLGDGDSDRDRNRCSFPTRIPGDWAARCMRMIRPEEVCRGIERFTSST
jgi:ADP-heptose:LPS heptosyltransferase